MSQQQRPEDDSEGAQLPPLSDDDAAIEAFYEADAHDHAGSETEEAGYEVVEGQPGSADAFGGPHAPGTITKRVGDEHDQRGAGALVPASVRAPEDDTALAAGEKDLRTLDRVLGRFDTLRQEVHLPVVDAILLERYIVEPVRAAVAEARDYASQRREVAERICAEMPAIAAQSAATMDASVEGSADDGGLTAEEFAAELDFAVGPPPPLLARRRDVGKLVKLINLLGDHKQLMLVTLEHIAARERALAEVMAVAAANEGGGLHDVEAAVAIHRLLLEVQRASVGVVEGVRAWREGLCAPHPFVVGSGENYLLKMFRDGRMLAEHPAVAKALPMQGLCARYPLFSNVPTIGRYTVEREARGGVYQPLGAPPVDVRHQRRIEAAEAYMHREVERQLDMLRALLELAQRGEFLPVIDISRVCPMLRAQTRARAVAAVESARRTKPLRRCVPLGGGEDKAGKADADGGDCFAQLPVRFERGVRIGSLEMRERYEQTLLMHLDVLQQPSFREAYDQFDHRGREDNRSSRAFKPMMARSRTSTTAGAAIRPASTASGTRPNAADEPATPLF